jgi:crotonobetainyl-CoA:carnitine CoA-transferase CaiB-like acyl-CoA transferase
MLPMVSVALGRVQVGEEARSDFAGSNNFHGVPYGAFPASDGAVNIGCNRDDFWRRLCVAMGRPELGTDPRYATYTDRIKHQREVHEITEAFTRAHTRAEITTKLIEVDVPIAGVLSMEEVVADEYLRGAARCAKWTTASAAPFTLPANAAWPDDDGHRPRVPRLGEQRDAVLQRELRMTTEDIGAWNARAPSASETAAAQAATETAVAAASRSD